MLEKIIAEIDAEINRLETVKTLLKSSLAPQKRGQGRPAQTTSLTSSAAGPKRRKMSRAAREKIRQAQLRRWAAQGSAKAPAKKTTA